MIKRMMSRKHCETRDYQSIRNKIWIKRTRRPIGELRVCHRPHHILFYRCLDNIMWWETHRSIRKHGVFTKTYTSSSTILYSRTWRYDDKRVVDPRYTRESISIRMFSSTVHARLVKQYNAVVIILWIRRAIMRV